MAYRKDQGRMARMTAFWSGTIFMFYGCTSLWRALTGDFFGAGDALSQPIGGIRVPVLGMDLSPAVLIVTALFALGVFLFNRWLERPKQADTLIETESEMKKVTWPTLSETMSGSITVIMTVLILMTILAAFDWALGRITSTWVF
ncbi:MAG: preprotein translocase subunit SecE [Planctomycetes bacterium]|nr:preprotein translocase subunit SecE [Planctomycetota bacterium]